MIKGEGMPQYRDRNQTKGDLYIRWEVDFPTDAQLASDPAIRQALQSALPPARPDLETTSETIEDQCEPVPAKVEQFGSNQARIPGQGHMNDDGWEDHDEMGGGQGPGMQCAPQ